jgi:hypothetical protein
VSPGVELGALCRVHLVMVVQQEFAMNKFMGSVVAMATAGTLVGCSQTPPAAPQHAMMMGDMPMMMGRASRPEMDKMMGMCMEHMQAMSARQDGAKPAPAPAR